MERVKKILRERRESGTFRALMPLTKRDAGIISFQDKRFIDFSSNDYLGLSGHPRLIDASREALNRYGTSSSASRLLSGDLDICHTLEEKIAAFKDKEAALVYNSGYQANLGIISALCKKGDAVFFDRLCHASIIDGILLSGCRSFRFRHNDMNHLESLLQSQRRNFKNAIIITETIFSMDGDKALLGELVGLKEKYNAMMLVDEAHATGIFGSNGSGVAQEMGLNNKIDLVMGTFGKALGSFGAYLAGTKEMIEYLVNASRSFIYSTALPPAVIAANIEALDIVRDEPERRERLLENSQYFRDGLRAKGYDIRGESQIIPLIIGDAKKAIAISEAFKEQGYWALPIRPPTVPANESRIRFSLTFYHTKEVLTKLIDDADRILKI